MSCSGEEGEVSRTGASLNPEQAVSDAAVEDESAAAYEKALTEAIADATAVLVDESGLPQRLGEEQLRVLDHCRRVLRRAGAPRTGADLGTRHVELKGAISRSDGLAHWLDEERQTLEKRLQTLSQAEFHDAAGRTTLHRNQAALKVQSVARGFLARQWYFATLENEAAMLSYEVQTETKLRWERVRQAIADVRPVSCMLQTLCAVGATRPLPFAVQTRP